MHSPDPCSFGNALLSCYQNGARAWADAGRDFLGRTLAGGVRYYTECWANLFDRGVCASACVPFEWWGPYRRFVTDLGMAWPLAAQTWRRQLDVRMPRLLLRAVSSARATEHLNQGTLDRSLRDSLQEHGIALADPITVSGGPLFWTVTDPAQAHSFRIEANGAWLDVFGPEEGTRYRLVAGGDTRSIDIPFRIRRARQGFALYWGQRSEVQSCIEQELGADFIAWCGPNGRTPVELFVVDYLDTDVGPYTEFGVGCIVAPRGDPLAAGMLILALPVSSAWSVALGRGVWNYPKAHYKVALEYGSDQNLICRLATLQHEPILSLSLPRQGEAASEQVPLNTYTRKGALRYRTVFTRSGRAEMLRLGGRADLTLAPQASSGDTLHIWRLLQRLNLANGACATPLMSGWTEHMSGEFGVPVALDPAGSIGTACAPCWPPRSWLDRCA